MADKKQSTREYRPWGYFEILDEGDGFKVKRIGVNPGGVLSLQSHKHRSEQWVVASGIALVVKDDETLTLKSGEAVFLPLGCRHRLANRQKQPLLIIEVQKGDYLGEDDITRYEDVYGRK